MSQGFFRDSKLCRENLYESIAGYQLPNPDPIFESNICAL